MTFTLLIEDFELAALKAVAKRLFTEDRLNGDQMRDMAQTIEAVIWHAMPNEER